MKKINTDVTLVGHAHIDAVWLWDHDETKVVLVNTFTRILDLMDEYDDLTFIQTSGQYYKWMEEEHPEIFSRICRKVEEGRWEVTGAMWVEPDCNIPDGESLCRQLLYGQKYFESRFGRRTRICWLPDVFGFSWILPTLLKDSGVDYFFTSKLIWQTRLPFPHFAFDWEGPDGSSVLGYQTPGLYNNLDIYDVYKQSVRFKAASEYGFFLAPFGEGDHGGGLSKPLVDMVHDQDHAMNCNFGNAEEYFDALSGSECKRGHVASELYLNTHRGTLTTQSEVKKANKYFEQLFNSIEKLQAFNYVFGCEKEFEDLSEYWECLLLNQFHDALPGSSFKKVYQDMKIDFTAMNDKLLDIYRTNLDDAVAHMDLSGYDNPRVFFNDLAWTIDPIVSVEAPEDSVFRSSVGELLPSQYIGDGKHLVKVKGAEPLSFAVIDVVKDVPARNDKSISVVDGDSSIVVSTPAYRAEISKENGRITGLYEAGSSSNYAGADGLGFLEIYEDHTSIESAWNICKGAIYKLDLIQIPAVVESGNIRTVVRTGYGFVQDDRVSRFTLDYIFRPDSNVIEFALHVDWHANYTNLQARFDYRKAEETTRYQIAFGTIDRKDSFCDSADSYTREKWEVSGHEWAKTDLVGEDKSMVIFSDSKYGWGQHGDSMHLTLLRSPEYPDPACMGLTPCYGGHTDQGKHEIRYGFMIADKDVSNCKLSLISREFVRKFNAETPRMAAHADNVKLIDSISDGLFVNTVKIAEDGDGIVLRLYETDGIERQAVIKLGFNASSAEFCNILEDFKSDEVEVDGSVLKFSVKPHAVVSLRIRK